MYSTSLCSLMPGLFNNFDQLKIVEFDTVCSDNSFTNMYKRKFTIELREVSSLLLMNK